MASLCFQCKEERCVVGVEQTICIIIFQKLKFVFFEKLFFFILNLKDFNFLNFAKKQGDKETAKYPEYRVNNYQK